MNAEIRQIVREELKAAGLSQEQAAIQAGVSPSSVHRVMSDEERGGKVPEVWAALFDLLNLEVTVRRKKKPVPYNKTEAYLRARQKRLMAEQALAEHLRAEEQRKAEPKQE